MIPVNRANAADQDPHETVMFRTAIKKIWREPNASLVLQTDYGEFVYIYDSMVNSNDGSGAYCQVDSHSLLLKSILSSSTGAPVDIFISKVCDGVVVGVGDVKVPLERCY
jgi:hypothetical protein